MKFFGMSKNKFLDDLATKTGKNGVELYRYVMGLVNKAPRGGERYGNFDAEDAFRKALKRSYGNGFDNGTADGGGKL